MNDYRAGDHSVAHEAMMEARVASSRINQHEIACAQRQKEIQEGLVRLHERMDAGQRMMFGAIVTGLVTLVVSVLQILMKGHA